MINKILGMAAAGAAACLSTPLSAANETYDMTVERVIDGDTIVVDARWWVLPELGDEISIRIMGIDTPEKGWRGQCQQEKDLGEIATQFAKDTLPPGTVIQVQVVQWDKYGGRINGEIWINDKNFAEMQIERGYAREYDGGTKESWCE
jgi:endonuclease YncB( thermonuclease family)